MIYLQSDTFLLNMRIKKGFILRTICGQNVISREGVANVNFSKLVSLNETAAFLFSKVSGEDFTPETMADLLLEEYDVTRERALEDCKVLCDQWVEIGIAE